MRDSSPHPRETVASRDHGLPRPGRAALPYAAILAATPASVVGHALSPRAGVAAGGAAAACAACAWLYAATARTRQRDLVDRYIATGAGEAPAPTVLAQRRAELVGGRERQILAATLRRA